MILFQFQILFAAVLSTTWAEPEPKKYKPEVKDKASNTSLTDDERKFLREVEAKFGIKSDIPVESVKNETAQKSNETNILKAPFPAVIAIEIVNDTDSNGKGKKRTIDANLGYGYRTNNGYTYTYFGKQPQEKGKFMVYPYSQEDIPPAHPTSYTPDVSHGKYTTSSPNVEIQPSRAYELVDVKDEQDSYHYNKPSSGSNTNYHDIKGLVSPPPPYETHQETSSPQTHPSTLYTTYNGHDFSALSGKFPKVMSNYLVEPSQLLKNPQYQSAGLSQDYIQSHHGSQLDQRVVPVLVLRIPSSYLRKPTAELYSNLPNNYPVSDYLKNVNLQDVVNNYFKKIGYSFAPQVMTYQSSILSEPASTPAVAQMAHYEPQHYATPYVQHPSYTQADYSGVQYSGVQPVMAKYPSTYTQPQYYMTHTQSLYQQPEQQYEYQYQYVPQSEADQGQSYYTQPQYQTQSEEVPSQEYGAAAQSNTGSQLEYGSQVIHETSAPSVQYGAAETEGRHASSAEAQYDASQEYGVPKEQTVYIPQKTSLTSNDRPMKVYIPTYNTQSPKPQYGAPTQNVPKETLAFYSQASPSVPKYSSSAGAQSYYYQKPAEDSGSQTLVLSENYPSKDHTLATVLPLNYKRDQKPNSATVQTVSYVTPMPSSKYQTHYKIMVPQTVLRNPVTEKVSYVNSHSLPYSQLVNQEFNPEAEYTVPSHFVPPVGKQKAPSYPRNYHSHPKRNAKPEKTESNSSSYKSTSSFKKQKERNDSKKSV